MPPACLPRNSLFSRDSQLLFGLRATGLSPRPSRHEEGVRRAVNYSQRRRAQHRLGCSRAALRQHRKNATTSLARSCCCRSSATGSRRRAPRRTCNGAPALAAPRAQYAPRAAPGGCPLPRVPFLEPQRGSYVNPALPSSRARGLEYMRALLQSMRMLRMYYRSCASCKIFCAAIPYPRLEVLKPN